LVPPSSTLPHVGPNPPDGGHFAFGELLGKTPQVTKGVCSWLGPTSSGSFTPVPLRGPAPNGHPCPDGALAASMRLDPLPETSVQPAPKSRLAVSGPSAYEDQERIKGFPAEAGPTDTPHTLVGPALAGNGRGASWAACPRRAWERSKTDTPRTLVGPALAGNGRGASWAACPRRAWGRSHAVELMVTEPAPSRLKPVPLTAVRGASETGDAERQGMHSHAEIGNDQDPRLPG
jgi:hypothetical protein